MRGGAGKSSRIPVRKKSAGEFLSMVDDAIEHGASEEAKQKVAAERAALKSSIPPRLRKKVIASPSSSDVELVGSSLTAGGGGGGGLDDEDDEKGQKSAEEKERRRLQEKKKQEEITKLAEEEERRRRREKRKQKELKKLAEEEARRRLQEKKKQKEKKKPASSASRHSPSSGDLVVRRVPKRSALLAMGGREAEEYKKKAALTALENWTNNAGDRWQIVEHTFDGVSTSEAKEQEELTTSTTSIKEAIKIFNNNPEKYVAMYCMNTTGMTRTDHDADLRHHHQPFTYILRAGTVGYRPEGIRTDGDGRFTIFQHMYKRLEPLKDDVLPNKYRDKYTDDMTFQGKKLHHSNNDNKPILPGRGMGIGDAANMKTIGEYADPNDVFQGACVGDCWLLSAVACLADFDWAIKRLFRKTTSPSLEDRPHDEPNQYIVTLWDLTTWTEVDVMVDERLPVRADDSGFLLGAKPSKDGKLWVPYLEKAIAIHCGGYDKLEGKGSEYS
jgi:hypothetical protein